MLPNSNVDYEKKSACGVEDLKLIVLDPDPTLPVPNFGFDLFCIQILPVPYLFKA
jgi:hypothetical protein